MNKKSGKEKTMNELMSCEKGVKADEIVRALISCGCVLGQDCGSCPYEYCSSECESLCGDAAALIESMQAQLAASQRRAQDARNELCLKCGRYHEAHNGACVGCRWKEI